MQTPFRQSLLANLGYRRSGRLLVARDRSATEMRTVGWGGLRHDCPAAGSGLAPPIQMTYSENAVGFGLRSGMPKLWGELRHTG